MDPKHILFQDFDKSPKVIEKASQLREYLSQRRSIRDFSDKAIEKSVIEDIIMTAASAPSGANKQPWSFCAISSASLKSKIRDAAEKEEFTNYNGRMSEAWLEDLKKFGTNWQKPFIEIAPWIIVMFKHSYELKENNEKATNYYVNESVGIAAGFLINAIHNAGLVTLTHTPSPMDFLGKLLNRPRNEKAYLLLPVGYPAEKAKVPAISKKTEKEVISWYE